MVVYTARTHCKRWRQCKKQGDRIPQCLWVIKSNTSFANVYLMMYLVCGRMQCLFGTVLTAGYRGFNNLDFSPCVLLCVLVCVCERERVSVCLCVFRDVCTSLICSVLEKGESWLCIHSHTQTHMYEWSHTLTLTLTHTVTHSFTYTWTFTVKGMGEMYTIIFCLFNSNC